MKRHLVLLTYASVVEYDIQPAELGDSLGDHALDVLLLADVAFHSNRLGSICDNLAYQGYSLLDSFRTDVCADDVGALASEQDGSLEADASVDSSINQYISIAVLYPC